MTKPPTHPSSPPFNPAKSSAPQQQSTEATIPSETVTDRQSGGHSSSVAGPYQEQGQGLQQNSHLLPPPQTQQQQDVGAQLSKHQQIQQQQALQQQESNERQQQPLHAQTGQQQAALAQQHSQQQREQRQSSQQQQFSQQQQSGQKQQSSQQQQSGQQQQPDQQRQDPLEGSDVHCMVGFVAGSRAEEMSKMSQTSVILNTLAQLDTMFGKLLSPAHCV